jgi:hypothetical protein
LLIGQDDVAVAFKQGALLAQRLHKRHVVESDGSKCRRQEFPSHPNPLQVALEVDGLRPQQDLEGGGLGVEELSATREQLFLSGVVSTG